jgi:hypothetical protein
MYLLTTHKQVGRKKQPFPIYKSSNYLVVKYVPIISYLSTNILDLLLPDWVIKVKPDINLVDVHPQLRHKGHPVDGMLRGCWFTLAAVITEA